MAANIVTIEDLQQFKIELLDDFKNLLTGELKSLEQNKENTKTPETKRLLKSHQVERMLSISPGTLQNLRINGTIPFSKIGGTIFYDYEDIMQVLKSYKRNV